MRFPFFSPKPPAVTRKIQGNDNQLNVDTSKLEGVIFDIAGSGNRIDIVDSHLQGVKFFLRGNNHRISIKRNCRFSPGTSFWLEDSDCSIIIGEHCTGEGIKFAVTEPDSKVTIGNDCM